MDLFVERVHAWKLGFEGDSAVRVWRVRDRFLLDPYGELCLPDFGVKEFELTFHVLPLDLESGGLSLQLEGGHTLSVNVIDGQWVGNDEITNVLKLPMAQNEWQTIRFKLGGGVGQVSVNGSQLAATDRGTPCNGLLIRAGGKGRLLVAVADYRPRK